MHPHHPMKPFAIPADWTPDQAMAVVDFLDELRCHLWQRYEIVLLERYRDLYGTPSATDADNTATPFIDDPANF